MEIVEIRNNLVKISYEKGENPILGKFVTIASEEKSYVAQFVNIKVDLSGNFAIARLLFVFSKEGIVDVYDGSAPDIESKIAPLDVNELLNLLPVSLPIKIGTITRQNEVLQIDTSVFEHNLVIFSEKKNESATLVSNLVRQLFQMKEKSVIIDTTGAFSSFSCIKLQENFKLPLNSEMIDFIFESELSGVESHTKAVIQDIFSDVSQYIKTLDNEFLPIENLIDVVASQYKETQMPELALLKNKLLKYKDANIFASDVSELEALKNALMQRNASIIDLKDVGDKLQKYVISYIHQVINNFENYTCLFIYLNDDNSDKKLLKKLLNNKHVLSVVIAGHSYKYSQELKEYAQNMILFAPQTIQHDFAAYNTFLSKLSDGECIVYGQLTQNIPFIIDVEELDLDLTQEDVFGEEEKTSDNFEIMLNDQVSENDSAPKTEIITPTLTKENIDIINSIQEKDNTFYVEDEPTDLLDSSNGNEAEEVSSPDEIENILSDDDYDSEESESFSQKSEENADYTELTDEDLDFMDVPKSSDEEESEEEQDTSANLDDFEKFDADESAEQQMVPVYPIEEDEYEEISDEDIDYAKGDVVNHPRYGQGTIEKIIKYGNKTLCSINFENVGRRLLDPSISEFERI